MMKNGFEELQPQIELSFRNFIRRLLNLNSNPLKYYYWTQEFFENNGDLAFNYFLLSQKQKEEINEIGKEFFSDGDIYFEVNKNSHRHDLLIKNINKLFPLSKRSGQSIRYEYLKEFIFWQILEQLSKNDNTITTNIVDLQKNNFLLTYLKYLLEYTKKPNFPEFDDYMSFSLTSQNEEIERKLKELDIRNVDNSVLRQKLSKLFVYRKEQTKIHFIFSKSGGEEKEELRELLDVMGREETGKLYRGQASSNWSLDSSLTREKKYLDHEAEMYYDILSLKPDAFINDKTVYERLITMQHFGMPTRLMDITRNPLVAIFFACNNLQRATTDGVVYTFNCDNKDFLHFEDDRLLNSLKKLFDKKNGTSDEDDFLNNICFIKGVAKNQRISNQSGDFIFVGKGDGIQEKLHKLPALTIIIDAPTKSVLLEQLESLNIHGGAVYPDLTHMSNYIRNKYLFEKRSGKDFTMDIDLSAFEDKLEKPVINIEKDSSHKSKIKEIILDGVQKISKINQENEPKIAELLQEFASAWKLDLESLYELYNDYFFEEKPPLRDDIVEIMEYKPKNLKERLEIVPTIITEFLELADRLNILRTK